MSKPDLEARVSPKIVEAFQAAIEKVGRNEFEKITELDDQQLSSILGDHDKFVPVSIVTLACGINKSHNDTNLSHSSVTECLKGTTIRMPTSQEQVQTQTYTISSRRRVPSFYRDSPITRTQGGKSFRVLGFSVNTATFLLLGYFLGGVLVSPLLGQPSCIGISSNPVSLAPCAGSYAGIIIGAIGGLAYTYYYFVKKL